MWVPATEHEILAAIEAKDLVETASFDAKASLPAKGKSKDLAIDVAAMSNDGGTLLYGVGEDENGRPTVPQPFKLAGARERVDQIVRTSISEPPDIQVREIQTNEDPSLGYLELPSIGWQLFILGSSPRDQTALPSLLATYTTRLLTEPLSGRRLSVATGTPHGNGGQ